MKQGSPRGCPLPQHRVVASAGGWAGKRKPGGEGGGRGWVRGAKLTAVPDEQQLDEVIVLLVRRPHPSRGALTKRLLTFRPPPGCLFQFPFLLARTREERALLASLQPRKRTSAPDCMKLLPPAKVYVSRRPVTRPFSLLSLVRNCVLKLTSKNRKKRHAQILGLSVQASRLEAHSKLKPLSTI